MVKGHSRLQAVEKMLLPSKYSEVFANANEVYRVHKVDYHSAQHNPLFLVSTLFWTRCLNKAEQRNSGTTGVILN